MDVRKKFNDWPQLSTDLFHTKMCDERGFPIHTDTLILLSLV